MTRMNVVDEHYENNSQASTEADDNGDNGDSQDTNDDDNGDNGDNGDSQQDATMSEDETEDDYEQTNTLLEQIRNNINGALSASGIAVP
jgi:hypothetical protein